MASGKNLHLEHLEDEIINKGSQGGREVIKVLEEMGKFLSGAGSGTTVTTKWDGAPAVVCGTDPADNRFFVGTKSVFAKTQPKICKSEADVDKIYDGELANKLKASYRYLSKCNIKGVLQGDLMFTGDQKNMRLEGESMITFKPNTILYAASTDSDLGREIQSARLGIVFHTKYTGPSLPEMTSSFDVKESDYTSIRETWIQRATFRDLGGVATMTASERNKYDASVRRAEGSLKQASSTLNLIQSGKKTLAMDTEFKKFFNNYVKAGQNVPSVEKAFKDYINHIMNEYEKSIGKLKSEAGRQKKQITMAETLNIIDKNARGFKMVIAAYMNIQACKNILVSKMKRVSTMRLFAKRGEEFVATTPEGFVAITGRIATKLVDRLEFSNLNFQSGKPGS
jgi:hypothetical protein